MLVRCGWNGARSGRLLVVGFDGCRARGPRPAAGRRIRARPPRPPSPRWKSPQLPRDLPVAFVHEAFVALNVLTVQLEDIGIVVGVLFV